MLGLCVGGLLLWATLCQAQTGSVQVTLAPAGAISAGAKWNVDSGANWSAAGGGWQSSGATVSGLSPGTHDVYFMTAAGWASPVSTAITITAGATTPVTGTYTQLAGSLTVELTPAAALAAGAQWNVNGEAWQNGGATVSGLTAGSGYTINFNNIGSWASPQSASGTISSTSATTAVAAYLQTAGASFTTLTPLSTTLWNDWYTLWDENIQSDYDWQLTPGMLVSGYSDYGGMGENLDWQLAPVLTGFYYGFMATSNTEYVNEMVTFVDDLISLETIEPDGYPGWPATTAGGVTGTDDLDWYYGDSMLGEAAAFRPIVLMACQMVTNPALKDVIYSGTGQTYSVIGQSYLALAETLYRKWVWRGGWRDTDPTYYPGGMISVMLPEGMDPATGYKTWITNPATNWPDSPGQNSYTSANEYGPVWIAQAINNGMSTPTNYNDEISLWLLAMWDATGNPEYQLRASKWLTYLKNYRMTLEDEWTSGLDGAGDLIWNYWEPAGSWDFIANQAQNALYDNNGIGNTKTWYGLHPNNGYYWIDTQCAVAAFEHGVVFNESDITTLVTDAKTSWTPSSGLGTIQYYFNPSSLLPGMSVSAYPASGTVTQVCGCIPNSLTPLASAAWPEVVFWNGGSYPAPLNGTIVSATWNGSTGTIVVKPTSGGANVTLDTNTSTEVWLLRMWSNFVPYDTQIQQEFEANEDTNPATASSWGATTDSYFLWLHSSLTVQSAPPAGISIGSTLGEGYTTNYTIPGAEYSPTVNLQAPATDPTGYTFAKWTVNGTNQTAGLKSITFGRNGPTTAVAQYTVNDYALTVQSSPPTGIAVTSSTADGGTTNYTVPSIAYGTSVNLAAPATDPADYTFSHWTVNGTVQTAGLKSITFTMPAAATAAMAQYTLNASTLNVQSTPPTALSIGSSTGHAGTTNYAMPSVEAGTSVNLQAPATDPTGSYSFAQWTLNGAAQTAGQQSVTFTMSAATTAVAQYTLNSGALAVQSTPPTGVFITSSTGNGGTTNYAIPVVTPGASVNLAAPATDPTGSYIFLQWTVNGASQGAGQQSITFTMSGAMTAVAEYAPAYALTVQSTPLTGLAIGSSASNNGTTNYTNTVASGADVNLQAPAIDPTGFTFAQWTVNGTAQTAGLKSITFTMTAATTAVAQYTLNTYALNVQSTPPTGLAIGSSTGDGGTTNYAMPSVAYGTSVNLQAPATDPIGWYTFSQWMLNGAAQTSGQQSLGFTMTADTTAVAQYTINTYTLTVQSQNPASGVSAAVSPADNNGLSGGTTGTPPLTRTYNAGTSVTLTAPLAVSGDNFQKWQENGSDYSTNSTITVMAGDDTYTAVYLTPTAGYMLAVQSAPPTGLCIGSCTGHSGTTNCAMPCVGNGTCVNLVAPATDPAGYAFSQWMVNGAAQSPGQKSITFTLDAAVTAVAGYTANMGYTLTVDSTSPTGLFISSSTGQSGTTNYTKAGVVSGASVNLQAPATDPKGYIFSQWTVNGAAQSPGQKSVTFTMEGAVTAVADYTANPSYTLTVESTPRTGIVISSSTGQSGTTNFTKAGVASGTSVNLQAPAADPAGYAFSQWTVNGAAQTLGQKSIAFTMDGAVTAVAQYTLSGYALTVESTPPTRLSIGSSTGQKGITNYYLNNGVGPGTSVNLVAPATDPAGYTFSQWTVNGATQPAGQKSITFAMSGDMTAVAEYTLNGYALTVQSTPPSGLSIASSTSDGGITNYTKTAGAYGASVNLQAPATDPSGYTFSQWTLNGAAQSGGQKSITFTMDAAVTAVAHYKANVGYTLSVQSTPPTGAYITSSTSDGGITNYTLPGVAYGMSVNLQAAATDPAGYTFSQWTLNGAAQADGQKSITFTMDGAVTAVAHYTANTSYALTVGATPPVKQIISSSTGHGGTTSYTKSEVAFGASVNLQAPAADPKGYIFSQWTVNGAAQPAGQKSVTFPMDAAVTATAKYNLGYNLTVESTPPTALSISSSTGQSGTTNYTKSGVAYGTSVNLAAPAADPAGYTFSQWTLNGAAQPDGQKSVTFTINAAVTAVAKYTPNTGYMLTVQSAPPGKQVITSSTSDGGITDYTVPDVMYGASVNLVAPATDPAGYAFSQWTVNGAAQGPGEKYVTFAMDGAMTAVAEYTANAGYALTVQSMPLSGVSISSTTGQNGTTNYTKAGVADETSVNLEAPATDPKGYAFSQWTVNGAAQIPGQKSITFTMDGAMTAVAEYTANAGYALSVQSTPPAGLRIASSTGQNGTTDYTKSGVAYGASVNLQAPATDPTGYTFSQWTVNGAAQPAGEKSITFTMDGAMTAVAQYTLNGYALTVESTPPTGLSIGSSTGQKGTTNYYINKNVASGASVNLQAPATNPSGYTFSQWTVNGAAQTAGQKSITFTMDGDMTAVAEYTLNGYTLAVQSTPLTGLSIGSSSGQDGTTNCTIPGIASGTSVNLEAPATDPAGYTFSQWTLNGAAQTDGQKSITFTMDAAVTAVAHYTANISYTLTVQSTPPSKQAIASSTGNSGTTSYANTVAYGTTVELQAPATDPAGYTFSQWTVNGAAQADGQKSITFTMDAAVTAVAHYTANVGYTLTVQSTPPVKQVVTSSTFQGGITNYTVSGVIYGASVNLQVPATDPIGYTFSQWTVNGAAQSPGQKSITFTMVGAMTAVAEYTSNIGYMLTVESTPPVKLVISSSSGQSGTTNYTKAGVAFGTTVNLQAPATDPAGYMFSQWTVSGAAQPAAQKSVTFTMTAATTAVAIYVKDVP